MQVILANLYLNAPPTFLFCTSYSCESAFECISRLSFLSQLYLQLCLIVQWHQMNTNQEEKRENALVLF